MHTGMHVDMCVGRSKSHLSTSVQARTFKIRSLERIALHDHGVQESLGESLAAEKRRVVEGRSATRCGSGISDVAVLKTPSRPLDHN